MDKIKVLYVIGTLDVGGTERQVVELALRLDRSRFEPLVCCLSSGGPLQVMLEAEGVPVFMVGFPGLRKSIGGLIGIIPEILRSLNRFRAFISRYRPEIVHGLLFWAYVIGAFVARVSRVPVVVASRRSLGYFKASKPHYLFLERIANWMTDLVIANSEAAREDAMRRERLLPNKIIVIHNGVDPGRFASFPDQDLRDSLGLSKNGPVVGVVSNFIHYKGYKFFLEGWASVVKKFPEGAALLIGDGPLRGEFEAMAQGVGLSDSVRFLGMRQDVPALLALMGLLVHPSQEEGFSNAILEAMAAGKPVVATAVGGNPEAVVHGKTGLLVPPRDSEALAKAMLWLLEHPNDAAEFGEAGRRRVTERFEISAMVRQYEAVYERLVGEKGLGRARGAPS